MQAKSHAQLEDTGTRVYSGPDCKGEIWIWALQKLKSILVSRVLSRVMLTYNRNLEPAHVVETSSTATNLAPHPSTFEAQRISVSTSPLPRPLSSPADYRPHTSGRAFWTSHRSASAHSKVTGASRSLDSTAVQRPAPGKAQERLAGGLAWQA